MFVRNLPQDVTEEKLEAVFKELGALRGPKPINLKIQKGKESFAFVDFEDSAAQQAAITGPVFIDGHQVCISWGALQILAVLKGFVCMAECVVSHDSNQLTGV